MEALITLANLLYLLSYFMQDILRLRILTIVAASILIAYFWLRPEPIMAVVYWNGFFILLNAMQVVRILYQRHSGTDPYAHALETLRARICARFPRGSRRIIRCRNLTREGQLVAAGEIALN